MKKIIIAAVSRNNIIGFENRIPWNIAEELQYFKKITNNNVLLMGRKTHEAIGKILPGRINLVLSKKKRSNRANNLLYYPSINDAIKYAEKINPENLFIIGGSEIYLQTINLVDELLISRIPFEVEGNKYFPEVNNSIWEKVETKNYVSFSVDKYQKIK
jgi:dihydrofolate reductase